MERRTLARPHPVLRILPRRHWCGDWGEPSNRLDRRHRILDAKLQRCGDGEGSRKGDGSGHGSERRGRQGGGPTGSRPATGDPDDSGRAGRKTPGKGRRDGYGKDGRSRPEKGRGGSTGKPTGNGGKERRPLTNGSGPRASRPPDDNTQGHLMTTID